MRRAFLTVGLLIGLIGSQAASAAAVASPYSFSDPKGDAPHGQRTDIRKVTITHKSTVTIVVAMQKAAPFSSWGTTGNLVNIQIHINGIPMYICASKAVAKLCNGESIVPNCPVTRSLSAAKNQYTFKVARKCLGNPGKIKLFVIAGAFGSTQISESDRAPNAGYSARVAYS